jgi:hypothetical protein
LREEKCLHDPKLHCNQFVQDDFGEDIKLEMLTTLSFLSLPAALNY